MMSIQPIGYEFIPQNRFESDLDDYLSSGGWAGDKPAAPPSRAIPIYVDKRGDHFMPLTSGDSVDAIPFIPGSFAKMNNGMVSQQGGFVPIDQLPTDSQSDVAAMFGGIADQLPAESAASWLGKAAANSMFASAPGGMLDSAMNGLGVVNPVASAAVGAAMGNALQSSGIGPAGSALAGMLSNRNGSVAKSLGAAGLNSLLAATGAKGIPGIGTLGRVAGGEIGGALADLMSDDGWAAPLNNATDALGGCFPGVGDESQVLGDIMGGDCFPGGNSDAMNNIVEGGCIPGQADAGVASIGPEALDKISDELMKQWQVDDESSAAETIAHKVVNDNKEKIKEAVKDPDAFLAKIKKLFTGEAPGTGLPAVRISDMDDKADASIMGVATILFQGLPVSRLTDMVAGPMAPPPGKPIVLGEPSVLSANLPTAFVGAITGVPSKMIPPGATTILVGGAVAAAVKAAQANGVPATPNDCPTAPTAPKEASSDSTGEGSNGDGSSDEQKTSDSTSATSSSTPAENDDTMANSSSPSDENQSPAENDDQIGMCELPPEDEGGMCERPLTPLEEVTADGKVTPQEHLDRNKYNNCPTENPGVGVTDDVEWWRKDPDKLHRPLVCYEGQPTDGSLGPSSYECCYHPQSETLIDNVEKSGTFNFYNSREYKYDMHAIADVAPHFAQNVLRGKDYSHVNMTLNLPALPPQPPK